MVIRCPKCARIVPLTDLRVDWDLGTCRACGFRFAISAVRVDPAHPQGHSGRGPNGVTLTRSGEQLVLRASTVAIGPAVVLGIVAVLWCALWILIMRGSDFRTAQWGFSEFLLVLIHIFLGVVAALLVNLSLMRARGRVEVRVSGSGGTIFSGVGFLGWRRRFDINEVQGVTEVLPVYKWFLFAVESFPLSVLSVLDLFKNPFPRVVLLGRHTISFGSLLTEEQRHSMIEVLGEILAERHRKVVAQTG